MRTELNFADGLFAALALRCVCHLPLQITGGRERLNRYYTITQEYAQCGDVDLVRNIICINERKCSVENSTSYLNFSFYFVHFSKPMNALSGPEP